MTAQNPAIFLQAGSHPAEDVRRALGALVGNRAGVVGATDLTVTQRGAGANMSVDVAGGQVVIQGSEATYQGSYICENRGTTNLVISAADPTNPRIDLVVAKVQDAGYSGATNTWSLAVVTGTPAGSPSAPAAPSNSVVLARVAVAALASSITNANITDYRPGTSALGGALMTASAAVRQPSNQQGQLLYNTDTYALKQGTTNTTGYQQIWNMPWGVLDYKTVTANQSSITTEVDLTNLTSTLTYVANRRIRLSFEMHIVETTYVAGDNLNVFIKEGATVLYQVNSVAYATSITLSGSVVITPSTGSHTYKLTAARGGGTGTMAMYAASTYPAWIMVEDLGPSANPA